MHSHKFDLTGAQRGSHDGARNSVLRLLDGLASVNATNGQRMNHLKQGNFYGE